MRPAGAGRRAGSRRGRATSFNPVDAGIRGGYLSEVFAITFPHMPGIDVAGTIAELGDGVTAGTSATRSWHAAAGADGAAAEYVVAPAEVLTAAPRSVPLADAAALPDGRVDGLAGAVRASPT